jgi:hypothetical protein
MMVLMALSSILVEQTKATTKNYGVVLRAPGLPRDRFGHKGPILCIRYGVKHSFRCILPLEIEGLQQSIQPFFHGIDAKKSKPIKLNGAFYTATKIF